MSSDAVSPTAHYTGYVWARNGLSHPELETFEGRVLYESLRPAMTVSQALTGVSLEPYLLARHRAIDALLEEAIEQHGVTQVIEVAAGLSPRGWRFTRRYGEGLTYVETDLPEMAERKRRTLERMGSVSERHTVRELDALREDGPGSLSAVTDGLDPEAGLAIVTEGLLGYLPRKAVDDIWRRFAAALQQFPTGRYISDLRLRSMQNVQVRAFRLLLSAFVRGRVYLHFEDAEEASVALVGAGFGQVEVRGAGRVVNETGDATSRMGHIIEASTR